MDRSGCARLERRSSVAEKSTGIQKITAVQKTTVIRKKSSSSKVTRLRIIEHPKALHQHRLNSSSFWEALSLSSRIPAQAQDPEASARQRVIVALKQFDEIMTRQHSSLRAAREMLNQASSTLFRHLSLINGTVCQGLAINQGDHIGKVSGVRLFDTFSCRAQLAIVGLHKNQRAGIDFVSKERNPMGLSFATSIVVSGLYRDNKDMGDVLEYCGSGGDNALNAKVKASDQCLTRGNRALRNSIGIKNKVRVIRRRGIGNKEFRYDGDYKVVSYEEVVGVNRTKVYMFTLKRCDGQEPLPDLFSLT
ncbi:histone-lysine N-methyltransferase family member SUVH2 [Selaginella moellendorffii]|uniref:histone-lysine N-methyltransferase family member SUVH2 n=1 Tax=Selaginella moellendorffii TaxID=88036 RepID=UPI000D1C6995|nr:histone-lysine N-methyltransferase family member SUVH2 [Selaginella moellendorffii]|eukprot:XP_024516926.1 histone-lysine N-methyltransferase family member SUVH2 [Selaginella moellendorffii]